MGNANHRALIHLRHGHDGCFDFTREHIETTRDDHVLLAIHNVKVTVFIAVSDIARMVPTKCANFSRCLRQVVIAGGNQRSASDNLSGWSPAAAAATVSRSSQVISMGTSVWP